MVLMLVQNQQAMGRLRSESMIAGPPLHPLATGNIDKCHAHVGPALAIVAGDLACCHHLHCNPCWSVPQVHLQHCHCMQAAALPVHVESLPQHWSMLEQLGAFG